MCPEGAGELDAGCDLDFCGCAAECSELLSDRPLLAEAERRDLVASGAVQQPPQQPRETGGGGVAGAVVEAVVLRALRELLRRWAQDLEEAGGRIGWRVVRANFADPVGGLVTEERAVGAMLRALGAGQPTQVIGFCLGEVGGRQDRGCLARAKASASDPALADPGVLNERHPGLFVMV